MRELLSASTIEMEIPDAKRVTVTDDALNIELSDGRALSVPLTWFPRLVHATLADRTNWRLIGRGEGVHWPDLDEDISVENLLSGARSGESDRSFSQWLTSREPAR